MDDDMTREYGPELKRPPSRAERLGHVTRWSDSSYYDEICTVCGATDARSSDRLEQPCPRQARR